MQFFTHESNNLSLYELSLTMNPSLQALVRVHFNTQRKSILTPKITSFLNMDLLFFNIQSICQAPANRWLLSLGLTSIGLPVKSMAHLVQHQLNFLTLTFSSNHGPTLFRHPNRILNSYHSLTLWSDTNWTSCQIHGSLCLTPFKEDPCQSLTLWSNTNWTTYQTHGTSCLAPTKLLDTNWTTCQIYGVPCLTPIKLFDISIYHQE